MSILDWLVMKRLRLPAGARHRVAIQRDLKVPMRDGMELVADRYHPIGVHKAPVVLLRSPYGKGVMVASTMARPLAAQGFQVLVQCCRGTGNSGGVFNPLRGEQSDGLDTIQWIKSQCWYAGSLGTYGGSYLGMTQWAIAKDAKSDVTAMAMTATLSGLHRMHYAGDSFMLEIALSWTNMMANRRLWSQWRLFLGLLLGISLLSARQSRHLPLMDLDTVVAGKRIPFWREWTEHANADDPYWADVDFHGAALLSGPPISMVTGWYDLFAPWQLRDFAALQRSGRKARLTIGPWGHTDTELNRESLLDAFKWFRTLLLGDRPAATEKLVRLFVVGSNAWREFESWPPAECVTVPWYLSGEFRLIDGCLEASQPDSFLYDPANPTPSLGGAGMSRKRHTVDNRSLENRSDVVCYTSTSLDQDIEVIGVVEALLYVSIDAASADFFVRLCDVDPKGVSWNVCDGLQKIQGEGAMSVQRVLVRLWPIAYRFKRGHRLRVQISGGAFPRWARNTGTAEPLTIATHLRNVNQTIHHNLEAPSAILLPVLPGTSH